MMWKASSIYLCYSVFYKDSVQHRILSQQQLAEAGELSTIDERLGMLLSYQGTRDTPLQTRLQDIRRTNSGQDEIVCLTC